MPTPSRKPTLLVITSETSESERIVGTLREEGLADRSVSIPNADRLAAVIEERGCDLILCCSYDRDVDLDNILAAYKQIVADIPLILIADPDDWSAVADKGRRGGARDLTRRHDSEHLKLVVSREFQDLLKRREASGLVARLQGCEESTLSLLEVTSAGVAFIQDGLHVDANPAYVRLFGYASTDDILAIPFLDLIASADQGKVRDVLRKVEQAQTDGPLPLDLDCVRADSSTLPGRMLAAPSELDGEPCLRIIVQPVQAAQAAPAQPSRQNHLSGLQHFLAELDARVDESRTVRTPFAIFFVKIGGSADLSRDMGLTLAMDLFDEFGKRLAEVVGDRGSVNRVNDDGFGIIADAMGELDAKGLSEHLKEEVRLSSRAVRRDGQSTDCEIGYFIVSDRAAASADILNAAHRLCIGHGYGAQGKQKAASTSLAARVKQGETDDATDDDVIGRKIEYALHNNQLRLVYQPIISLMGDNQENYSVLVRLLDEEENLLEARDFIGTAIRRGMIEEIDKWTIRSAIQVISEQRKAGHNLSLFVNLSEDTFRNPSIVLWICDCLRELDVRGNWLTFQFQEEVVVGNLASIGKLVETLKKIKCRVAINRFGMTERPEMLLQGLSLDFILLKPSFAQHLADDTTKQQRLLELAKLAREFNVKSIVTGVEDARALTVLWTAGVDYVQGNFLQRPSPTLEVQA